MAKVKITGHASGTGILTVTAPNTSTDRTITLPDATGTLLNSDGSGASLTALNATNLGSGTVPTARLGSGTANNTVHLRGDGTWAAAGSTSASDLSSGTLANARLPAGTIVQVVHTANGDYVNLNTTGWTDSGTTVSFTPVLASSKLFITGVANMSTWSTGSYHGEGLHRILVDSTQISQDTAFYCSFPSGFTTAQFPSFGVYTNSDTNAKTIKLQGKNPDTNSNAAINQYTGYCQIIIWEVVA